MKINVLATADALSDLDLLACLVALAGREREVSVELVAHLAVLDTRPSLLAAKGFGSLFAYCTQALRLSEDAACNRIEAARACRRFPVILTLLASGALSLTSARLLRRHLTEENHQAVLSRACGRSRPEIEALVAELAPRPDVPSTVRKVPTPTLTTTTARPAPAGPVPRGSVESPPSSAPTPIVLPARRPVVQVTAPARYRVEFTIGQETHEKLRRLQSLLRREIPSGDPAAIFDRALNLLLEKVERTKLGLGAKPRAVRAIRPGTDTKSGMPARRPRDPSATVRSAVWTRDGGQCAFLSEDGRRCTERTFLEFHHAHAYANGGDRSVKNISLRCRRHNQYEAELVFGPHGASAVKERDEPYTLEPYGKTG